MNIPPVLAPHAWETTARGRRPRQTSPVQTETGDELRARQIGAALAEADTARLLGLAPAAVQRAHGLLRLRTGTGGRSTRVFQFAGRTQLPGVAEVVTGPNPRCYR